MVYEQRLAGAKQEAQDEVQANVDRLRNEKDMWATKFEQKRKALRAIDLIKEKRTGLIKGRTVADGSKQ